MRLALALAIGSSTASIAYLGCGNSTFTTVDGDAAISDAAASDAISSSDAAVIPGADPCALDGGYAFCDNFDLPDLSGIWGAGGPCTALTIDGTDFVSPSHSVRASTTTEASPGRTCTAISADIAASAQVIQCEADVKIDTPATRQFSFFQIIDSFPNEPFHAITLQYSGDQPLSNQPITFGEAAGFSDGGNVGSLKLVKVGAGLVNDKWFHVAVTIDYGHRQGIAVVAGVTQTLTLVDVPDGGLASTSAALNVGYSFLGDGGVAVVHYDNVFCKAHL